METFEILGYLGAVLIGFVLGLLGGGGSILTVPVLVYIFQLNPIIATGYSLFVVGVAALFGVVRLASAGVMHLRVAMIFGIPSILGVYATRKYLIPNIPDVLLSVDRWVLSKETGIMLFFAVMMLVVAWAMIRKSYASPKPVTMNTALGVKLVVVGLVVGVLTGIMGAGGGFMIVPALVLLGQLSIRQAIGTSLLVIAVKSLIGFTGDVQYMPIDWSFLAKFTGVAVIGLLVGIYWSRRVSASAIKRAFGYFVGGMAVVMLIAEVWTM